MVSLNRRQKDINWLLQSPSLIEYAAIDCQKLIAENKLTLDRARLDFEPSIKSYRLGHYFESLWFELLERSALVETIEQNKQVIINKETLGEFDSIYFDKTHQKTIHCELAIKFYLQIGVGRQLGDWVGPNLKDRFDDKYLKLVNHQLQLSQQEKVIPWLLKHSLRVDDVKSLSRGRLFYPLNSFEDKSFIFPQEVSKDHLKGFWVDKDYFFSQLIARDDNTEWYYLPKKFWLSEISREEKQGLEAITEKSKAQEMQQVLGWNTKTHQEIVRGFIVPSDWIERARIRVKAD